MNLKRFFCKKGIHKEVLQKSTEISSPYFNQIINEERFPSGKVAKKIVDHWN
jgi:hypothetical protein